MNDKSYKITIPENDKLYMTLCIHKYKNMENSYLNKKECLRLQNLKNKIFSSKNWDKYKKFSNDYELIHIPNRKNKIESIASYQPLSRSYFKMVEIIKDFHLINTNNDYFRSSHLVEGPGGFMEAVYNLSHNDNFLESLHFGITLYSKNKEIPGWNKAYNFLNNRDDIKISYGADNTGNLYNPENIKYFSQLNGYGTCDLVTPDGGFDFSIDFNKQEQLSYRLILCEIVGALYIQKLGGSFVIKFFDIYTIETCKLLYLLCCFYDEVFINKPLTSRPANSEKYIICKGFRGIDYSYLDEICKILNIWCKLENTLYINDIFSSDLPKSFIDKIKNLTKKIQNIKLKIFKKH